MAKFDDIKVGDQVIVNPHGYGRNRYLATVERVTATQFVADGCRFTKRGWKLGHSTYLSAKADVATPELIQQVQVEQRYRKAQDKLRRKLDSVETLWREIDRNHDSYKWAATLEAALPHLTAAVEVLKLRQTEIGDGR
jgi:ribosome biogenesis protein Tsr3